MLDLERHKNILKYLYDKKIWVKGKELAHVLGVSDRTIRADVISIKEEVGLEIILSSRSTGYCFNFQYNIEDYIESTSIYEPSDRLIYIAKKLILSKKGVNIYDLAEELFVSDSTINSDLIRLKKMIEDMKTSNLELKKDSELIQIEGKEAYFNKLFIRVMKIEKKYILNQDLKKFFNDYNIEKIIEIIILNLEKFNFTSRYISINELAIDVLLILERLKLQIKVPAIENDLIIEETREFEISNLILKDIEKLTNCKIKNNEILNFTYSLWNLSELENQEIVINNHVIKNDYIYEILEIILVEIKTEFFMDFTSDKALLKDLATHTSIAVKRAYKGINVYNPIKEQMIAEHPFLFDIAIYIVKRINDFTNILLNEEEISFLVAHLGVAVDKANSQSLICKKLNVLLVVLEGKATLKHIIKKITDIYGDNIINIYGISSPKDIEQIENIPVHFDLFISTTRFSILNLKQDIIIRPELNIVDEINLRESIDKKINQLKENNFNILFNKFFHKELFFYDVSYESKQKTIDSLCAKLKEGNYVDEKFEKSVHERERLISTALNNKVALPHPTNEKAIKTAIVVSTLNKAVDWGGKKVKVVFLFAISKDDVRNQKDVYDFIIKLVSKDVNIDELVKCRSFDEFKNLSKNIYLNNG